MGWRGKSTLGEGWPIALPLADKDEADELNSWKDNNNNNNK